MHHITQRSNKEFDLAYPIEKVKQCLVSTLRLRGYMFNSKNDLLNIYNFSIVKGFHTGIVTATFKKIDDNNTNCKFEIINTVNSTLSVASLDVLLMTYLNDFTNLIQGKIKIVDKPKAKPTKLDNRLTFLLVFAIVFVLGFLFFVLTKH